MTRTGMRTVAVAAGAVALLAFSGRVVAAEKKAVASADTPRPEAFWGQNEEGQWIKLMPTPDRAVEQLLHDQEAARNPELVDRSGGPAGDGDEEGGGLPDGTSLAPSSASSVYPGSYGSGPLIDHGGKEMSSARMMALYYNSAAANGTVKSGTTLRTYVTGFLQTFGGGIADYSIIQQYGSTNPISPGFAIATDYVGTGSTPKRISDSGIRSWLTARFNGGITADPSTLYLVFLPPGTKSTMGGGGSCTSYCGYHSHYTYNGKQIKYATLPFLNCSGCLVSTLTTADSMSIVTAHEIREAVTDPGDSNVNAWYDSTGYEADDKCAWHNLYRLGGNGYYVQPEYSNQDGGCVVFP